MLEVLLLVLLDVWLLDWLVDWLELLEDLLDILLVEDLTTLLEDDDDEEEEEDCTAELDELVVLTSPPVAFWDAINSDILAQQIVTPGSYVSFSYKNCKRKYL